MAGGPVILNFCPTDTGAAANSLQQLLLSLPVTRTVSHLFQKPGKIISLFTGSFYF